MDAAYLQKHVQGALTEALLAMAIHQPEDSVEFVGEFLVEYVRRDVAMKRAEIDLKKAEEAAQMEAARVDKIEREKIDQLILQEKRTKRLAAYLEALPGSKPTKQELMDSATDFIADYLGVPAAYLAVKKTIEDNDVLYYTSSSPGQSFLVGRQHAKVEYSEDEPVERQGIAFDAFIVPEPPEEEEVDVDDESYVPKPAPKAQPLVVANTMREKRVKFFGIPQLGSFLAVPLALHSLDHEEGCVPEQPAEEDDEAEAEAEGEQEQAEGAAAEGDKEQAAAEGAGGEGAEPGDGEDASGAAATHAKKKAPKLQQYGQNRRVVELLLCVDTVGRFRPLAQADSAVVAAVGEALVAGLERVENSTFTQHVSSLHELAASTAVIAECVAGMPDEEARALEEVVRQLSNKPEAKEPEAAAAVAVEGEGEGEKEHEVGEGEEGQEVGADEEEPPVEADAEAEAEAEEEPEVELPESLKPRRDATAVLAVWSRAFASTGPLGHALGMLATLLLPAPPAVRSLVGLVAAVVGLPDQDTRDVFGEVTWERLRLNIVPQLSSAMANYDASAVLTVPANRSLEALRASFEEAGLSDPAVFPSEVAVLPQLATWVGKAFEARAAAITYYAEVHDQQIETVISA